MKNMTTKIAAVIVTLFFGSAVSAEGGKADFRTLGANGDGIITADEAREHRDLMVTWATLDVINADGTPDESEFSNHPGLSAAFQTARAPQAYFGTLDANRDGFLSADEARKNRALMPNWARLDLNVHGTLDVSVFSNHAGLGAAFRTGPGPSVTGG